MLFFRIILFFATFTVLAETNPPPSWPDELAALGITPDPEDARLASMIATVQTVDPKARLLTGEEWLAVQHDRNGYVVRVAVDLTMSNGLPVIASSSISNLLAGDVIAAVGTNFLAPMPLPEARKLLRASAPTNLLLQLLRSGETTSVEVALAPGPLASVDRSEMLSGQIAFLGIHGLYSRDGEEVVARLRQIREERPRGLILDLRGASGDDTGLAARLASFFAAEGQFLFAFRNLRNEELERHQASAQPALDVPAMVLVDGATRGAAEILAAILPEANPRVLLVGETTSGDFLVREPVVLQQQTVLLATRVLDTAGGYRFTGEAGVVPAVVVTAEERQTHAYEPPENLLDRRRRADLERQHEALRRRTRGDGILEKAHDLLTALKALKEPASAVSSSLP